MYVLKITHYNNIASFEKKDSSCICFIAGRHFRSFLSQYVAIQPGYFETLEGKVVGQHQGAAYYTLGQRKGLGIGGAGEAWFVADKDMQRNVVIVVQGTDHPSLYSNNLVATELSWVSGTPPTPPFTCHSKVRYRQEDHPCIIERIENGKMWVRFPQPQRAVTPGQSIVIYEGSSCLGGGMIISKE